MAAETNRISGDRKKKDVDPPTWWNSPYCEEVGETEKVRELGWSRRRGRGSHVLPTTLCLYFTGTITESRLLISRLPWHCLSWQLASLLRVPPFQELQQWIAVLSCCQCQRLAPPLTSMLLLSCYLLTFLPFSTEDMICWCMHTLIYPSLSAGTFTNMYAACVTQGAREGKTNISLDVPFWYTYQTNISCLISNTFLYCIALVCLICFLIVAVYWYLDTSSSVAGQSLSLFCQWCLTCKHITLY